MKASDLKASILQLAVSGKLVRQNPNDEPASALLKRIKKEREQLINEGKIKKGKPLAEISEDEIPFEIPASWEWVRLGDVTHNFGQKKTDTQFTYIDVGSIDNKNGCLGSNLQVILPKDAPSRARKIVKNGTVIYSTVRPYLLNICIIESEPEKEFIASTAFCILAPFSGFLNTYLYYCLRSPVFTEYVSNKMMGMAYPAISDKELLTGLIPLPPLAEQQRIVARIEELMPLVEAYDREEQKLSALEAGFPDALRQSILQYAVEGKLVPQKAEDGTAAELLVKIRKERDALVKEGKIRKGTPLSPVSEEEKPFDIPASWEWVRLGNLLTRIGSGSTPTGGRNVYQTHGIPFIRSQNVYNDGLRLQDVAFISDEINNSMKGTAVQPKDILLNITGASIGRCAVVPDDFIVGNVNQHVSILRCIAPELREYLHTCICSPYFQKIIMEKQVGLSREGLSAERLKQFSLPLPPLAEQHRIVERIEELKGLCDRIPKKVK